jgi:hypothetical protein
MTRCGSRNSIAYQIVSIPSLSQFDVRSSGHSLKGLKVGTDGQKIPQIVSCGKGNLK